MKIENEITFGATYWDVYTSFSGVAIGFCHYQTDCDQVLLAPSVGDDGKKSASEWFDVQRLVLDAKAMIELPSVGGKGFGDWLP